MAYKRRKFTKKYRSKRRYVSKGRRGFTAVAASVATPEVKTFKGNSGALGGTSLTPNAITLNAIPQSTTSGGRIGRDVYYMSVEVTLVAGVSSNETAGTDYANEHVRLLIVWDTETNGAAPALSTLLDQQSATTPYVNSVYNTDNINRRGCRYSVLCDTIIPIRPVMAYNTGATTQQVMGQTVKHFRCRLGKRGHFFNSSTPSVADILKGGLFAFVIAGANGAAAKSSFQLAWQLYYRDS